MILLFRLINEMNSSLFNDVHYIIHYIDVKLGKNKIDVLTNLTK